MDNKNAVLFKDLEFLKLMCWDYKKPESLEKFIEKLNTFASLAWDVDGDKCFEFGTGATLTIWQNGVCDFDADGITLALRH